MSSSVLSPESTVGPEEMPDHHIEAIEDLEATRLYLLAIGRARLLRAEEEVELAKRIEAGLFAKEAFEDQGLFNRIVEDNLEDWELAGAMPGEIPEDERARIEADLYRDLPTLVSEGDAAKDLYLRANVRLVVSLARRRERRYKGIAFLDIIQNGNLGLIHAVEKFDYTKGYKFSTYATWWIVQRMDTEYAKQIRAIRLPLWQVEAINRLLKVEGEFVSEYGRMPTTKELADALGVVEHRVIELKLMNLPLVPLDAPAGDDRKERVGDLIPDTGSFDTVNKRAFEEGLHQLMRKKLSKREIEVIQLYFGFDGTPRTLQQVGDICGITDERVRQIKKKALEKLEKYGKHLLEFVT